MESTIRFADIHLRKAHGVNVSLTVQGTNDALADGKAAGCAKCVRYSREAEESEEQQEQIPYAPEGHNGLGLG